MSRPDLLWLILLAMGAVILGLGLPLAYGRVPPNHWYGVRTPRALASREHWYALNRYGGKALAVAGLAIMALGGACLLAGPRLSAGWALAVAFSPLLLLPAIVATLRFERRLPPPQ